MPNVQPTEDRVLIKPDASDEVSPGGIVIPQTAQEKPANGIVVAIGPGKLADNGKRTPLLVKVGDRVVYGKYAGTEIKIAEVPHKIMHENEILARYVP